MLNIQPDHFVAVDGSIQSLTGDDYAEAADTMLSATETIPDDATTPEAEPTN